MDSEGEPIIIENGEAYRRHRYGTEKELEKFVVEHAQLIFGKNAAYFDTKKKITSKAGTGAIPDGYIIDTEKNRLYIVEIELVSHDVVGHIMNQVSRFELAMKNEKTLKELLEHLAEDASGKINAGKICREFGVFIVIDDVSDKLKEVLNNLSEKGLEVRAIPFETYRGSDGRTLHKFTTFTLAELEKESKKWSFKWTTVPVEKHLEKASDDVRAVFKELSRRICCIDPSIREVSRKAWTTYQTGPLKNFCTIKIKDAALEISLKVDKNRFSDEKGITKDIERTPAWTFDKVFYVRSKNETDYAVSLIRQARACVCNRKG